MTINVREENRAKETSSIDPVEGIRSGYPVIFLSERRNENSNEGIWIRYRNVKSSGRVELFKRLFTVVDTAATIKFLSLRRD